MSSNSTFSLTDTEHKGRTYNDVLRCSGSSHKRISQAVSIYEFRFLHLGASSICRFCFAKTEETLELAAEALRKV